MQVLSKPDTPQHPLCREENVCNMGKNPLPCFRGDAYEWSCREEGKRWLLAHGQHDAHLVLAVAVHTACVIWAGSSKTSTLWQQTHTLLPLASHKPE